MQHVVVTNAFDPRQLRKNLMQQLPPGFVPLPPAPKPARAQRGTLLTVLLVLLTLGGIFGIGGALLAYSAVGHLAPEGTPVAQIAEAQRGYLFSGFFSAGQFGCAFGMWGWKKWGAYGFALMSVLLLFASAKTDPHHNPSYGNLVWLLLVAAAVVPKWSSFED